MYSQRKFKTSLLFGIDEDTIDETNDAWISKRKDPAGMVLPLTKQVRWREALDMIRENHSLITPRVFRTTLEQDPPVEVIDYMLSITPTLASIPNEGPTALQVAVQQGACLDVVRAVLLACPFALCVTNSQNPMDPLSFASKS